MGVARGCIKGERKVFCGLATAVASAASFTMGRDAASRGEDAVKTERREFGILIAAS